jgi:hypothetical protein
MQNDFIRNDTAGNHAAGKNASDRNTARGDGAMRNDLVGYLCGALDDEEMRAVEQGLADPLLGQHLSRDLGMLRRAVAPLACDIEVAPPAGLADRTLAFVAAHASRGPAPTPLPSRTIFSQPTAEGRPRGQRSGAWLDRAVMAATAIAACVLVAPLVLDSIRESRELRAKRNVQNVGLALHGYAESHRFFPTPPDAGSLSRAGLYAPTLVSEQRIVADDGTLLCPDSVLARRGGFRVPTLDELRAAEGTPEFDDLVETMGGDYGYTLGHRDVSGALYPNVNRRRAHFPIMADKPDAGYEKSDNHPDGIHHVLYEDGHVQTVRRHALHAVDHLFRNRLGNVAAGVDPEDAVIGHSRDQP